MPSDLTLEALARVILRAVEFDYDHLYEFTYRNRFGGEMQAHHEYMDEGPWADEVAIGDLPLHIGETMGFLYDFGDEWQFKVVLERIDHDMAVTKPVILEEHGKAPEQYRW